MIRRKNFIDDPILDYIKATYELNEDGVLVYKSNKMKAGYDSTSKTSNVRTGKLSININTRQYKKHTTLPLHFIYWFFWKGEYPEQKISPRDRDYLNFDEKNWFVGYNPTLPKEFDKIGTSASTLYKRHKSHEFDKNYGYGSDTLAFLKLPISQWKNYIETKREISDGRAANQMV